MKRLSKYEKLTLGFAVLLFSTNVACAFLGDQLAFLLSASGMIGLIIVAVFLLFVRLHRMGYKQMKAREEIYQVLYGVQANSEAIARQWRKTRQHLTKQSDQVINSVETLAETVSVENESQARSTRRLLSRESERLQADLEKTISELTDLVREAGSAEVIQQPSQELQDLSESLRLKSNVLSSQMDAQWELLQEISDKTK